MPNLAEQLRRQGADVVQLSSAPAGQSPPFRSLNFRSAWFR